MELARGMLASRGSSPNRSGPPSTAHPSDALRRLGHNGSIKLGRMSDSGHLRPLYSIAVDSRLYPDSLRALRMPATVAVGKEQKWSAINSQRRASAWSAARQPDTIAL